MTRLHLCAAVLSALALHAAATSSSSARGAVNVNFSGGGGTPLSMSLPGPISYTMTADSTQPFFVFKDTGDVVQPLQTSFTSSITFSVDGGPPQSIESITSGVASGEVTTNDLYLTGTPVFVGTGQVVTLSAGTLTTSGDTFPPAPPSGAYTSFITNSGGLRNSTDAIPEPAGIAVLALGALALLARQRRRA